MNTSRCSLPLAILLFAAIADRSALADSSPAVANRLVLLDGTTVAAQSLSIQADQLSGEGVPAQLTLDDLRRIERPGAAMDHSELRGTVVELRNGRIESQRVTLADEKFTLRWIGGESLALPLDLVTGLRFAAAATNADFEKALRLPFAEFDRVFVADESGQVSLVTGLVDALDEQELRFEVSGQQRQLPRSKLFGIVLAQPAMIRAAARCAVVFVDGSVLSGESLEVAAKRGTLSLGAGLTAEFPWTIVSSVTIRSRRVAYLSDLQPLAEEQQPLVTLGFPAQRDRGAAGQGLKLGSRVYEKGLGVHARSLLTFPTEKQWDIFSATIGLDSASGGKGDCIFQVLADGQLIFSKRMRGTDDPQEIQLPVTGRAQVTLRVEPGAGLDLGDHANWCDARLIRNKQ